jgi:hypothetical protein
MMMMNMRYLAAVAMIVGGFIGAAQAQDTSHPSTPLPAWEQMTPAQREELIAPMRDRWNRAPQEDRQRMFDHARRWRMMTPEQRREARKGMHRWEKMDPQKREQARALFERMRTMNPEQRKALRAQWQSMSPEQRRQWIEKNRQNRPEAARAKP